MAVISTHLEVIPITDYDHSKRESFDEVFYQLAFLFKASSADIRERLFIMMMMMMMMAMIAMMMLTMMLLLLLLNSILLGDGSCPD